MAMAMANSISMSMGIIYLTHCLFKSIAIVIEFSIAIAIFFY